MIASLMQKNKKLNEFNLNLSNPFKQLYIKQLLLTYLDVLVA